jgi:hypothetical protein
MDGKGGLLSELEGMRLQRIEAGDMGGYLQAAKMLGAQLYTGLTWVYYAIFNGFEPSYARE